VNFRKLLCAGIIFSCSFLQAQVTLPYQLNQQIFPSDSAKIISPQTFQGMAPGIQPKSGFVEGDIVPDFVLYDTAGTYCHLSELLGEGKPVLLIAGSYTCPQTRKNVRENLNRLQKLYGEKINIRLIYTLEAHPRAPDVCPYTGAVYTSAANFHDSILFRQPVNYLQRKKMAEELIHDLQITTPVLIDSPDNMWWKNFGPAPNNAYLLTPFGMVYKKYATFESKYFEKDFNDLLKNTRLMKNGFDEDVLIETNSEGLYRIHVKNDQFYSIIIFDSAGKITYTNGKMQKDPIKLSAIPLIPDEYGVVIKIYNGHSYCVHYTR
jgi:hypothetical protein